MGKDKTPENKSASVPDLPGEFQSKLRRGGVWWDIGVIGGAFLLLAPILSIHRVTDFMIFCIFALSFDLLYGYMGRLSFGHLLFLGTGAYGCGLFMKYISKNPLLAILVGIVMAGILGMMIGPVIVRATGACFSLMALAFNQIGFFLVLSPLKNITNGEDGFGIHAQNIGFLDLGNKMHKFFFIFFFLLLVFYLLKRLTTSSYGILVRSIKEDETRVRFLGYNTYYYKWLTFVVACILAGLAGTLTALNYNFVNPNVMDVHVNVGGVFACGIGGGGNLYGAVIGAVAYMMISNYLAMYIQRWEMFLGISLLIIVFRFRRGIWGSLQGLGGPWRKSKAVRIQ